MLCGRLRFSHVCSKVIGILASLVFACPGLDWSSIDHLETFAGKQAVTKGELEAGRTFRNINTRQAGRRAVPFELKLDPATQDILSDHGFVNAIYNTLRLAPGAGSLHAPVCSTWVFMHLALDYA